MSLGPFIKAVKLVCPVSQKWYKHGALWENSIIFIKIETGWLNASLQVWPQAWWCPLLWVTSQTPRPHPLIIGQHVTEGPVHNPNSQIMASLAEDPRLELQLADPETRNNPKPHTHQQTPRQPSFTLRQGKGIPPSPRLPATWKSHLPSVSVETQSEAGTIQAARVQSWGHGPHSVHAGSETQTPICAGTAKFSTTWPESKIQ